jgi:hypothetical protein
MKGVRETWGNLFEVENAFCSKNLISRVLSHIAFSKQKLDIGKY